MADILLNGTLVGCTDERKNDEPVRGLQSAREELVRQRGAGLYDGGHGTSGQAYGGRQGEPARTPSVRIWKRY